MEALLCQSLTKTTKCSIANMQKDLLKSLSSLMAETVTASISTSLGSQPLGESSPLNKALRLERLEQSSTFIAPRK
eukprot:13364205-Ditylum_brightwellii.AAC.1